MIAALAKLSPPRLPRTLVARERLYLQLDEASSSAPAWIWAAAGSGKTVLAAAWARIRERPLYWIEADEGDSDAGSFLHYLQRTLRTGQRGPRGAPNRYVPDSRQSLAMVARSFVREFYACLPAQTVLVIDNAERIAADSEGFTVLAALVSEAPQHVSLLVLSRLAPAAALARARVGDALAVLSWDELRLTLEETRKLAIRHNPSLDESQALRIHELADGWPAGARLLAECALVSRVGLEHLDDRSEALFGYMAREVFGTLRPQLQQLLLSVAPLPWVSVRVAVAASGCDGAGALLAELAGIDFFTARLPGATAQYRLHPLLRHFLLGIETKTVASDARVAARRRAAIALVEAGEFETAAALWTELRDWPALVALLEQAGDRLLEQGRHRVLIDWLDALPTPGGFENPLLGLWRARALMSTAPADGLTRLAALWPALEREAPLPRLADAWNTVVCGNLCLRQPQLMLPWHLAAQRLLARLDRDRDASLRSRVLAAAFVAFSKTLPQFWIEGQPAAIALASDPSVPADLRLLFGASLHFHALWHQGGQGLPKAALASLRGLCVSGHGSLHQRLVWLWIDANVLVWLSPDEDLDQARELLRLGSELIAEHGIDEYAFVHVLSMTIALHRGERGAAESHAVALQAMPAAPPDALFEAVPRHLQLGVHHLSCGRLEQGATQAALAVRVAELVGSPWQQLLARCLAARAAALQGHPGDASRLLREAARIARNRQVAAARCAPWLAAAAIALQSGRNAAAIGPLRRGLDAMAAHGVLRPPPAALLSRDELEQLCAHAWRHGVNRPWVQHLVSVRGLAAPLGAGADAWPWALRITTFDTLTIERDGQALRFGRKAPRKVLELLRFLLAGGERAVPVAQVVDALWPDEEGDAGYRAFITALHRLRKLVGETAVVHAHGRVGLDARVVSIDRVAFERLLGGPADKPALEAAIALYRGDFLCEYGEPWTQAPRERLRARFKQAVCQLGQRLSGRQDHQGARLVFEAGLRVEPAAEEFYQGAIRACLALGLAGEALDTLHQGDRALGRSFGVALSAQTWGLLNGVAVRAGRSVTDR